MTHEVGGQNRRKAASGTPMARRKPVESVDIKKPMPTFPTGSAADARKSPEKRTGSVYTSTSGQILVSVGVFSPPGHVKLGLTLELPRTVAERLSARPIREQKNLEAVIIEALKAAR